MKLYTANNPTPIHNIGDTVWIYGAGAPAGVRVEAKVEKFIDLPRYGKQYILSLWNGVDRFLLVRSIHHVSDSPDQDTYFWRQQPPNTKIIFLETTD